MSGKSNRIPTIHIIISSIVFLILVGIAGIFIWGSIQTYKFSQPESWKEYFYTQDNFKISVPSEPKMETKETQGGQNVTIQYNTYTSTSKTGTTYIVDVATYPLQVEEANFKEFLDQVIQGSVKSTTGVTLVSSTQTTVGQHPAANYLIKVDKDGQTAGYLKGEYILVGKTMYGVQIASENKDSPDYDKFVNSFSLLNN